jgi:hypothetical protein
LHRFPEVFRHWRPFIRTAGIGISVMRIPKRSSMTTTSPRERLADDEEAGGLSGELVQFYHRSGTKREEGSNGEAASA